MANYTTESEEFLKGQLEDAFELLESTRNLMMGITFDPNVGSSAKQALINRAEEIQEFIDNNCL